MIRTLKQMATDVAANAPSTRAELLAWLELILMIAFFFIALAVGYYVFGIPLFMAGVCAAFLSLVVIWIMSAWRRSHPSKGN